MKKSTRMLASVCCVVLLGQMTVLGQDWPQWRGPNRDARASDFKAPETWPDSLTEKWKVTVGDGVATPSLVGDKLYVFSREDGNEITRCLNAETGEVIWQDDGYEVEAATGGARNFSGPRSSPAVADGKVVTLGIRGQVSCLDAATGEVLWRKNDYEGQWPMFFASSSPMIKNNLCVVQLGGLTGRGRDAQSSGAIVAYDLSSGEEKWKWAGEGPGYASPAIMQVDGTDVILAPTDASLVGINVADGSALWKIDYRQGRYNAASPVVAGQQVFFAGPERGISAVGFDKQGNSLAETEIWRNEDQETNMIYNTPVLKDGMLFGLSGANQLFCVNAESGETAWVHSLSGEARPSQGNGGEARGRGGQGRGGDARGGQGGGGQGDAQQGRGGQRRGGQGRGGRGGGRRGGGGGRGGYGSVVDAGSVLLGLTPAGELFVFEPSAEGFKEVAKYTVGQGTYAYPVAVGNRIFIKDQDSVTLWTVN